MVLHYSSFYPSSSKGNCELSGEFSKTLALASFAVACVLAGCVSYWLIAPWSELAALIVASLCFYSVIFCTANHRIAKHFSIYQTDDKLVINAAFTSFIVIDKSEIREVNLGTFKQADAPEQVMLGKGAGKEKSANIELTFSQPQTYFAMLGQLPEPVEKLWLNVEQPEALQQALTPQVQQALSAKEISKSELVTMVTSG